MDKRVAAIVVSFNTRDLTLRCVEALERTGERVLSEIWVVDNASSDGTTGALRPSARLRLLALSANAGFGPANNAGYSQTSASYIALVNSDAFVSPNALAILRDYLEAHPEVGVVGPRLLNADGSHQESRFLFPTPLRAFLENAGAGRLLRAFEKGPWKNQPAEWLSGACLMIRREAWEASGGFDEDFFLYSEETDLQRRIRSLGWGIHWVPSSEVTHLGGASGGSQSEAVREHFFAGVDRYFQKHHGLWGLICLRTAMICGAAARWICFRVSPGGARGRHWSAWILRRQLRSSLQIHSTKTNTGSALRASSSGCLERSSLAAP